MIVFIAIPWFLPAYRAGGPIQSVANLINNFNEEIEYRVFCGNLDINGETLSNIENNKWTFYNTYTKVWYADKGNLSQVICEEIQNVQPDVLYIIGLFSWHFNIVPILFCKATRKIVSVRGMVHPGALSQKRLKKRLFLTGLKFFDIAKKVIFHATNTEEEAYIKNEFRRDVKVVVAGNFSKKIIPQLPLAKSTNDIALATIALISPMKNHLMVLKALKQCTANIRYNIYGPIKDEAYWQNCKYQIAELPSNICVQYHGEISPESVTKILGEQHVFIMPSKSENFGHAIAEALSVGRPVITSHFTPWNNLEINKAGINADTDIKSLAKVITFFAELNQHEYNSFVTGAKQYYINNTNITAEINSYRNLFFGEMKYGI